MLLSTNFVVHTHEIIAQEDRRNIPNKILKQKQLRIIPPNRFTGLSDKAALTALYLLGHDIQGLVVIERIFLEPMFLKKINQLRVSFGEVKLYIPIQLF